jgi:large subunit ribosomal protein L11
MAKETVSAMVEGGKATAGPPLGPALGPKGINIGQVIAEINKKTKDLAGMQVPVEVIIDSETKEFEIKVGTPPTTALIKKEIGIEKAAISEEDAKAGKKVVGDLKIEQAVKVAKVKRDAMLASDLKNAVKEVIATTVSMKGITVEGMDPKDALKAIDDGKFDEKIK